MTSASRTTLRAMVLCLVVNALLLAADLAGGHPRLVFRPQGAREHGRTFEEVRKLYRTDVTFRGIVDKALALDSSNAAAQSKLASALGRASPGR